MCYDPEVPAGYQEADLLQAQYEAESAAFVRRREQGVCTHGWMQGMPENGPWPSRDSIETDRLRGHFPNRPTNYAQPEPGYCLCLDCGEHVPDPLAGVEW